MQDETINDLPGICPKCKASTERGFGLAGGGYGPYVLCTRDKCDFFKKIQIDE